jgi:hypothetical protein
MMDDGPAERRFERAAEHVVLACLFYFIPEKIRRIRRDGQEKKQLRPAKVQDLYNKGSYRHT